MKLRSPKLELATLVVHHTKKKALGKFLLVLAIFLAYFGIISFRYGFADGAWVTFLTWSFFVLCTPIADAGFLLDFPVRLVTQVRMFYSELVVWVIALVGNLYLYLHAPSLYDTTKLLQVFKHIIENPFPTWLIVVVSAFGTFLSIRFGDELMDTIRHEDRKYYHEHKDHHRLWVMVFIFVVLLLIYYYLLSHFGISLS